METTRDGRSMQSSMRSHNCQSTQSFLPILPSQSWRVPDPWNTSPVWYTRQSPWEFRAIQAASHPASLMAIWPVGKSVGQTPILSACLSRSRFIHPRTGHSLFQPERKPRAQSVSQPGAHHNIQPTDLPGGDLSIRSRCCSISQAPRQPCHQLAGR